MFSKTKVVLAGVLVVTLLVIGVGGTIALAQGPTPTPPKPPGAKTWGELYWQALAARLGISVDKLQQATQDARKDALDQAVKQGLLTQAQADKLLERLNKAKPGTAPGKRSTALNALRQVYASVTNAGLDAAAKTLGMPSADLKTALRTKTLLELAREKNVDVTKLRTAIADAAKAALDQAVKDGKLTPTQADAVKARITPNNIDLNRRGFTLPLSQLDNLRDAAKERFGGRMMPALPRFKR